MAEPPRPDDFKPMGGGAPATAPLGGRLPADVVTAGTVVGEYHVERMLGEGGMGQVYAARQPVIGKRVAIKVLKASFSGDAELVRRFVGEARAVNKIGHPNIIDIFSFGQLPDGRQYFVMELLEGESLADRIVREPLPPEEAKRLLLQTCHALEAAHDEKVVHRDLKPDNLWIGRPRHGDPFIKVLDFGIAKLLETEVVHVTATGVTMGTPTYMSPEQCLGQNVDHRTDIYAMGVLLYRIFAGRLPFDGHSFAEVVAQQLTAVPSPPSQHQPMAPALEALIMSCLEKDPGKRPQTARELAARLEGALSGAAVVPAFAPTVMLADGPAPATRQGFPGSGAQPPAGRAHLPSAPPVVIEPRPARRMVVVALVVAGVGAAVALGLVRSRRPTPAALAPAPPTVSPAPPQPAPAPQPAPPIAPAEPPAPAAAAPEPPPKPPARPARKVRPRVDERGIVKDNPY